MAGNYNFVVTRLVRKYPITGGKSLC
uniref:Uncharacterized protein n=1 Tax=Arundo donax TaxID=35708 RepID=A0A0A9FNX5_ARUDO